MSGHPDPAARPTGGFLPGIAALLVVLAAGCSARINPPPATVWTGPAVELPSADGTFTPSPGLQFLVDPYPETSGPSWLGADVASSIRLSDDRYLWLFGDTLMGSVSDECPKPEIYCDRKIARPGGPGMIRNSVGVAERDAQGSFRRVVKWWGLRGGRPEAIFPATEDGRFYWPLSGIRVGTPVFVAANLHTPESGLAPVGNAILRIANPDDDPPDWNVTTHELPHFIRAAESVPGLSWTMALAQVGRHVYIFGSTGEGFVIRAVLARVEVESMNELLWTPTPEYLMVDEAGQLFWGENFEFESLHALRGLPGVSETSVQYREDLGWFSYQLAPFGFQIRLYTAPDLEGPWRNSGVVYQIPAPWSLTKEECADGRANCPAYIAYAVKAHPELAPDKGQVISYNVNLASGVLSAAEEAANRVPGFYVPQMLVGPHSPGAGGNPRNEPAH